MRRLGLAVFLLGGLCLPGVAQAQVKVAVFDLEAGTGAQDVAARISAGLKKQVSNHAGHSLAQSKSLAEIKLVFGCADTPLAAFHECLAKVGQSLNSDRVVFGKVRKHGGSYHVSLTYLDVKSPTTPRKVSEKITASQAAGGSLDSLVIKWHGSLFGLVVKGTIRVICNVPGSTVNMDGRVVGECDAGGLRVAAEPGNRQVTISRQGYVTASRNVQVKAAEVSELQVDLKASAVQPPVDDGRRPPPGDGTGPGTDGTTPPKGGEPKPRDPNMIWKVLFYSTVTAGAAVLVASIFTGMKVKSLEKDKEAAIIDSWSLDPEYWVTDTKNACLNNRGNQALVDICNKGSNMATTTNALIGVGAALVAGSGIFLYMAYFSKSKKERSEDVSVPSATTPNFVLTPDIWQRGGGVSATLRF